MIVDVLRQENIRARVEGEYLVGAMGGLPASGLVRVVVDEDDYELARRAVERWSATQADDTTPPLRAVAARPRSPWGYFAAGVLAGAVLTYLGVIHPALGGERVEACRP